MVTLVDRRYRVIFAAESRFRLMADPTGQPAQWKQTLLQPDGDSIEVLVRDLIETVDDIPTHRGLAIEVLITAENLDLALETALPYAETTLILLSSVARAPASSALLQLAYEITPGVTERAMLQRFPAPELPNSKTPVPQVPLFKIVDQLYTQTDQTLIWRIVLSMSWHRQALDEKEPVFRFLKLWIAFEALEPRLADLFGISNAAGFQGLRRFAEEAGYMSETVTTALGVRRDLFHARRVRPADIRDRATPLLPILEGLLVAAWTRLLGVPELTDQLPSSAVTPYPMQWEVRATLLQEDVSMYGSDSHPHFEGELSMGRLPPGRPGDLNVQVQSSLRLENISGQWRPIEWKLTGPSGPNIPTFTDRTFSVKRAGMPPEGIIDVLPNSPEC